MKKKKKKKKKNHMGIPGLLPMLGSITQAVSLEDLRGLRVAVDGYVWLHRASYGCAAELCRGEATARFVEYCMFNVRLLRYHGVEPVVVLDGAPLPSKRDEEAARSAARAAHLQRAREAAAAGRDSEAFALYQRAVDVSSAMAAAWAAALRAEQVEFVVAPYEADAQMAWMCHAGVVDAVLTEDSDLLAYGVPCVLLKLDRRAATVARVRFADLRSARAPSFAHFSPTMFRQLCVLMGCDYLPSLAGMGPRNAHDFISRYGSFDRALRFIRLDRRFVVPHDYEARFRRAEMTFLYQRVFNTQTGVVQTLNPLPADLEFEDLDFVGPPVPADIARRVAACELCPMTRSPLAPLPTPMPMPSVPGSRARRGGSGRDRGAGRLSASTSTPSLAAMQRRLQPSITQFLRALPRSSSATKQLLSEVDGDDASAASADTSAASSLSCGDESSLSGLLDAETAPPVLGARARRLPEPSSPAVLANRRPGKVVVRSRFFFSSADVRSGGTSDDCFSEGSCEVVHVDEGIDAAADADSRAADEIVIDDGCEAECGDEDDDAVWNTSPSGTPARVSSVLFGDGAGGAVGGGVVASMSPSKLDIFRRFARTPSTLTTH
jgi:exonuclease-1